MNRPTVPASSTSRRSWSRRPPNSASAPRPGHPHRLRHDAGSVGARRRHAVPPGVGKSRRQRRCVMRRAARPFASAAGMQDNWVWMAVEDRGPGISPEDHEHVWQRFWRGDRRTRPRRGPQRARPVDRQEHRRAPRRARAVAVRSSARAPRSSCGSPSPGPPHHAEGSASLRALYSAGGTVGSCQKPTFLRCHPNPIPRRVT